MQRILDDVRRLGGQTLALARIEMDEKRATLVRIVVLAALAAAGFFFAALLLLAGAAVALSEVMQPWAALCLLGGVVLLLAIIFLYAASVRWRRFEVAPRETLRSLAEDAEWLREKFSRQEQQP
jgi:uncharacterized membrane protein YqjE